MDFYFIFERWSVFFFFFTKPYLVLYKEITIRFLSFLYFRQSDSETATQMNPDTKSNDQSSKLRKYDSY